MQKFVQGNETRKNILYS